MADQASELKERFSWAAQVLHLLNVVPLLFALKRVLESAGPLLVRGNQAAEFGSKAPGYRSCTDLPS